MPTKMRQQFRATVPIAHLFLVLYLSLTANADPEFSCKDTLNPIGCDCSADSASPVQINCALNESQSLTNVLETIAALPLNNIEKVAIRRCRKEVDVLESVPILQIRHLAISNCGIKQVHENAFDNLTESLEVLYLVNNSITTLPFLKKLKKLQSINLSGNLIKDIPEQSFDGLDQLRQLRLKNNRICLLLPNALIETKRTLELLDLGNNCFVTPPAHNIRNHASLTHLSLAGNQIMDIAQAHIMNLPSLVELRLSSNRLRDISPYAFRNIPKLKRFLARDNLLTNIDAQVFQGFKELESIDLSGNNFVRIPPLKENSKLLQLKMSNNSIKRIEPGVFSANRKLEVINLDNNQISQIGRNLDSLNTLTTLSMANNNLEFIERMTFDGLKNLKVLILRGNQIVDVNGAAFLSTPNLVIIELSGNRLKKIHPGTFAKLTKVFYLGLSNNSINTIEPGAFENRIGNVLIDGNPLHCNDDFDTFVTYLVKNNIKTFLPNQADIVCASPPEMEGKRLREMMIEKVSESKTATGKEPQTSAFDPNFLSGLLGGNMDSMLQGSAMKAIPGFHAISKSMPFLDQLSRSSVSNANPKFNAANKQDQGIVIDITKVPPKLIEHVLRGGNIPGIPRQTLDTMIKQHMERMYYAAAKALNIEPTDVPKLPDSVDPNAYLTPIGNLPQKFLTGVMNGGALPHLTTEQTNVIKVRMLRDYYIQRIIDDSGIEESSVSVTDMFSPKAVRMIVLAKKMMPAGYDLSKLSPEVMKSVMAGELPDMSLLPLDMQKHIIENLDELLKNFSLQDDTVSIDDILSKLPTIPQPQGVPTWDPYDLVDIEKANVIRYPK